MNLGFAAAGPWIAVSGVSSLALLIWVWRLESRLGRASWRRPALALAAICLFLLAVGPTRRRPVAAGSAILVTAGAMAEDLDRIGPATAVLAVDGAPAGLAQEVVDLPLLGRLRPELRRWLVAGVGLEPWELQALAGEVEFAAPAEPRPGVDRVVWRRRIALGEALEVRGSVIVAAGGTALLRLVGPAGVEESRDLSTSGSFALSAVPRQEGRFLYRLELDDGTGAPQVAAIDFEVTPRRLPRVLWLEGAPGFESREVKTWLRDLGGVLTVRSRISRGRFRYDYLNRERYEVPRLDPEILTDVDLLVVDGAAWEGLAASERDFVARAVGEGLGLLLIPALPSASGRGAPPARFEIASIGDLEEIEVEAMGPGISPLAPLTVRGRQFTAADGQRVLLADGAGRALAVGRELGLGRVAATLVEGSYRWALRGESGSHRRYWSHLLTAVARSPHVGVTLPPWPLLVDRPLAVDIVSPESVELAVVGPDGVTEALAPAQDPLDPRRWRAVVWPRSSGWHRLEMASESTWFHVAAVGEWQSWRERRAHDATARRAALEVPADSPRPIEPTARPMSRWPLFLLLLLALTSVWADEQWRRSAPGS